jgi:endonuclease/exonuclease/phosphatase family metal-dependent hydrolase
MIRVASYNMRKAIGSDRRRRPERTIEVLRELDADIIALQEADRRFGARLSAIPRILLDEHSELKPVEYGVRPGGMGWHGNAILVRKSVEILDAQTIHIPALEPRGAVRADLLLGGQAVRVVGMHLDLSGLWRRRQAHAIINYLDSLTDEIPTILMGDLNEWSPSGGCLRDFGSRYAFATCGRSFHARRPVVALDRIMVSAGLGVDASGVHMTAAARKASDHLPIWADLKPL